LLELVDRARAKPTSTRRNAACWTGSVRRKRSRRPVSGWPRTCPRTSPGTTLHVDAGTVVPW